LTVSRKRVGVYGGAFDPPHSAHHSLAQAAIAQIKLDQMMVLPTGRAWHKPRLLTSAEHRIRMARIAFADLACVEVDERETQRMGATYTIDTLSELLQEQPDAELFLCMGADQFSAFETWHRWQDITKIATICIAGRDSSAYLKPPSSQASPVLAACKMRSIDMPNMPVSATQIRQNVSRGLNIDHLVNPDVARYIAQHGLYAAPNLSVNPTS
jgi:nicotinate-nucleotide adenylyltransferase